MNILEVDQISLKTGKIKRLDRCSFDVKSNEIFGLMGQNGSGKSSLIRSILGLQTPQQGEIRFFCQRSEVGYVPQHYSFYEEYSVERNIRFFRNLCDNPYSITKILDEFELSEFKEMKAAHLSGGYKRLLNMAVSMVRPLRLLILDEPTANMDIFMRRKIMSVVERVAEGDMSVILTTHFVDETESYCDRIALMASGRIRAAGTVREIVSQYGGDYVIDATCEDGERLMGALKKAGYETHKERHSISTSIPHAMGNTGIVEALRIYSKFEVSRLNVQEPSLSRAMQVLVEHD